MTGKKVNYNTSTIAEMTGGIILAKYEKDSSVRETSYQTEAELERQLIDNLVSQGYERLNIKKGDDLSSNLRVQIQKLNNVVFSESEWERFLVEYLDSPNDGVIEKTRKVQNDHIYDFKFDDGSLKNIMIIDKKNIHNNKMQVVNQVSINKSNRYDVTILVNGLPLVHIELKKRGVNLKQAFDQIHRYQKESFNDENSLYKYVQIFVISNGTYTRYFANNTHKETNDYSFSCEWADARNRVICDLEDFTKTFFEKRVILEVLTKYCVFNVNDTLLIMRPYQIAATERILWKIKSSYESKKAGSPDAGGFIWHTTGSGKTLTSFKTSRLATSLEYIDKVFFVVDRKDLDYQTMKEYQSFQADSVNGSKNTKELKRSIEKKDNRIVVTTIQKLNEFVKKNPNHEIYDKHCVIIYDECHRSQFGDAQRNIKKSFKKYYQFGFTGTPIFAENNVSGFTTSEIFGAQLHSYVITDAIRDGKVLKFKVDYNNITPKFKNAEKEQDDKKLEVLESQMLLHEVRISEITKYIINVYNTKTHRNEYFKMPQRIANGFNAMLAVQSIKAAKLYYQEFEKQQSSLPEEERLRIATIFSCGVNQDSSEENVDDVTALSSTDKDFLNKAIFDYNTLFKTNFSLEGNEFQNYYKDLSKRVKGKEVDLIIVVGMFLTGFDAPSLNTLFVDKNLRYHGLIQAYSRTNRILNSVKTFGNIVCFRDLEKHTKNAIKTFGDENSVNIILEKSYSEYMDGFVDEQTGKTVKGYKEICNELITKFPDPTEVKLELDKKEFAIKFGELIKLENILRNFDEFNFFERIVSERLMQDMRSLYNIILDERRTKSDDTSPRSEVDFSDVEFQIDLLKTDEINLDYILALILEKAKEKENIESIKEEVIRVIRSSLSTKSKEQLIISFINSIDLTELKTNEDILEAFYNFARKEKIIKVNELIEEEKLKQDAQRIILNAISKGQFEHAGTILDNMIPPITRIGGAREKKKEQVLDKIRQITEVFVGI